MSSIARCARGNDAQCNVGLVPPAAPDAATVVLVPLSTLCCIQFWELDTDHDFYINKEDLLRYGNHSLTYRIVDRIFSQVRKCVSKAADDVPNARPNSCC